MTEFEKQQNEGKPSEFDELIGELSIHIQDPYLVEIHNEALACEKTIAESGNDSADTLKNQCVRELDNKWRYMGKPIIVTGKVYTHSPERETMEPQLCIDRYAISRGFIFIQGVLDDLSDPAARIAHLMEWKDESGQAIRAIARLKDDVLISLPSPSPELRERRFAYYHPEDATFIDELAQTARREDQMIADLKEYFFSADINDKGDFEALLDGSEYVRRRANVDHEVNYNVSVSGDVILLDGEDEEDFPRTLTKPYTRRMRIKDIELLPADVRITDLSGKHRYVPFIRVTAFDKDPAKDRELLIPCSSILWISSGRYDTPAFV